MCSTLPEGISTKTGREPGFLLNANTQVYWYICPLGESGGWVLLLLLSQFFLLELVLKSKESFSVGGKVAEAYQ